MKRPRKEHCPVDRAPLDRAPVEREPVAAPTYPRAPAGATAFLDDNEGHTWVSLRVTHRAPEVLRARPEESQHGA